jgi:hypothetical protein
MKLHDPWHLTKVFCILGNVRAEDDNQIGLQLSIFANDCPMESGFVKSGNRKRPGANQRLQRAQPAAPRFDRDGRDAGRMTRERRGIREVGGIVGKAENMHFVLLRKMPDLLKGDDLIATIRRKGNTLANKKDAHRLCQNGYLREGAPRVRVSEYAIYNSPKPKGL